MRFSSEAAQGAWRGAGVKFYWWESSLTILVPRNVDCEHQSGARKVMSTGKSHLLLLSNR